jgi:N-acetylglucosaminyldiphosphoundecaprenol N-acetyl-beta-D-mannosaminyltransferase
MVDANTIQMRSRNHGPAVDILGLRLPLLEQGQAVSHISRCFGKTPIVLFFVNAHTACLARKDPKYHNVLRSADLLLNDGVAVAVAARLRGQRFPADLPGNVVIPSLLREEKMPNPIRVFLLGSESDVVTQGARWLGLKYSNVRIVGFHHGFMTCDQEPRVAQQIADSSPHILLVGMGNPRQEFFIHRYRHCLGACLMVGVGGLIDIWGGKLRDYPPWATKLRLHWFCRLLQEPRRLSRRYFIEVPYVWLRVLLDGQGPAPTGAAPGADVKLADLKTGEQSGNGMKEPPVAENAGHVRMVPVTGHDSGHSHHNGRQRQQPGSLYADGSARSE